MSETLAETTTFTSYEIVSIGAESCDASAKIVTLNVNSNRPKVLNDVDTSKLSWDSTTPAKLVGKFDTDAAAKAFMTSINGEDTVVATFEGAENPEEYVGINVSGPTAIEDDEATTKTSNGTFTITSFTAASGEGQTYTPATATGTVTSWVNDDVPAGTAPTSTKGTFAQGPDGKWTLTYAAANAPEENPGTETVSASYSVKETHYYVTLVFPETLPAKPSTLKTRGTVEINTVSVGDIIKIDKDEEYYVKAVTGYGAITLTPKNSEVEVDGNTSLGTEKIINLTATTNNILAAFNKEGFAINTYLGNNASPLTDSADIAKYNTNTTLGVQVPYGTATQYSVGDLVVFVRQKNNKADEQGIFDKRDIFEVQNINTFKDIVILSTQGDCSGKL